MRTVCLHHSLALHHSSILDKNLFELDFEYVWNQYLFHEPYGYQNDDYHQSSPSAQDYSQDPNKLFHTGAQIPWLEHNLQR